MQSKNKIDISNNTIIKIKDKKVKIEQLEDYELDFYVKQFKNYNPVTKKDSKLCKALKTIIKHRSQVNLKKLHNEIIGIRIIKAVKTAAFITNWIEKSYKN